MKRKTGYCKYKGNRCHACLNASEMETFTSAVTRTSYKINHSFDCDNKFLIYLMTCLTSLKQYVGSTINCFRCHWNNYTCDNRKIWELRLVCKNIFLNILIVKGIMGSYLTFQLHWSIKLMQKSYQRKTLLATYPQNVGTSCS